MSGTNTDAVLFCADPEGRTWTNRGILDSVKKPTTSAVSNGIEAAVKSLLEQTRISPSKVSAVMIGSMFLSS